MKAVSGSRVPPYKHAYNAGEFAYYFGAYPFIDIIKISNGYWGQKGADFAPTNSDGWLTALPPGHSGCMGVVFAMDPQGGYFPPGNYELFSSSAATLKLESYLSTSPAGTFITNYSGDAVGSVTFTANLMPAGSWDSTTNNVSIFVRVINNTASNIAVLDLKLCLVSEKAALLSGEIFKPQWLADYAGAQKIRFLDWQSANTENNSKFRRYADVLDSVNRVGYDFSFYPVPTKICMALCKKLNCAAHFTLGSGSGWMRYAMDLSDSTIYLVDWPNLNQRDSLGNLVDNTPFPHGLVDNERVMISNGSGTPTPPAQAAPILDNTVYYARVVSATKFHLASTSGGSPITFTGTSPTGTVVRVYQLNYPIISSLDITPIPDLWQPMAASAFSVWPQGNVELEWCNEVWNSGYVSCSYSYGAGSYIATGGIGNRGASYAWHSLGGWKAFENVFPANQVKRLFSNQAVFPANALSTAWDYVDPGIISTGQTFSQIMGATLSRSAYCFAPYLYVELNAGDFYSGAELFPTAYAAAGNTTFIPDSYWTKAFLLGITDAETSVNVSVSYARGKVPNIPCTTYEWGLDFGAGQGPQTDTGIGQAIGVNFAAFVDGTQGVNLYKEYFNRTILNQGIQAACHLQGPEGWQLSNTTMRMFGVKSTQQGPLNIGRNEWFKTV